MIHIQKGSEDLRSLIETREEDLSSGQVWDDCPGSIETIRFFKKSGIFLSTKEKNDIVLWLVSFRQYINAYGDRYAPPKAYKEVLRFLTKLQPNQNRKNKKEGKTK